jgi:hypothetical protein
MGSIYTDGKKWKIIGPTEAGPQYHGTGGEIAVRTSRDEGKTWKKEKDLTTGSQRNHSYVRRPHNLNKEFVAFWADGDADKLSESHLYFSDSKGDVFELPYDLKEDFEKPIKKTFTTKDTMVKH